ncbi:MAG: GspE/PulE family protein, partial [Candidatus Sericytochromatia bacterium]
MALVKMKLGEILLNANLITEGQLKKAVEIQKETRESLGMILIKQGYISEASIKDALELQYGLRYVNLRKIKVAPEVLKMVPENLIRQHQIIPIQFANNRLTLAMVDPTNLIAIDDVRFLLKGVAVQPVIITEDEYFHFLETQFKVEVDQMQANSLDDLLSAFNEDDLDVEEGETDDGTKQSAHDLEREANDAPIIRMLNALLTQAVRERASDIHIEPTETALKVRYRVDGILREQNELPKGSSQSILARIKIMGHLDISERRVPQDGRIRFKKG